MWSRCFDVVIPNNNNNNNNNSNSNENAKESKTTITGRVLPPFADMFNHKPDIQEKHYFDSEKRCLISTTQTSYKPGEQIYINYGVFPNHKLLRLYGFALESNLFDTVEIWAPMSEMAPLYELKINILKSHGIENEQSFELRYGRLPNQLLSALRVQRVQPTDLVNVERAFSTSNSNNNTNNNSSDYNENQIISVENEMMILGALKEALLSMLSAYSSTLQQDKTVLLQHHQEEEQQSKENTKSNSSTISSKLLYAVRLRFGEKVILLNNIELLNQAEKKVKQIQQQQQK